MTVKEENVAELSVDILTKDDAADFDEWKDEQDFGYFRVESQVVDFINSVIKHESLNSAIESSVERALENTDSVEEIDVTIENIDETLEELGIPLDSEKSVGAKTHLTGYIDARTTYYHRLLG